MQQAIFSPFVFLAPRPAEKNFQADAHEGAVAPTSERQPNVVRDEHRHTTTQDGLTRATPALAASRIASTPTTIAIVIIG